MVHCRELLEPMKDLEFKLFRSTVIRFVALSARVCFTWALWFRLLFNH